MTGMCRLCASLKRVLITVTDQSGDIAQKLLVCCRLQLEKEGPLPRSVCSECMEHLDTSYKFLSQVQEAQEKLHAFFGTQFEKVATAVSDDNTQSFTISSVSTLTPHTTNQVREYILPEATVTNVKQELPYDEQLADAQMDAMTLHTSADNWTSAVDQNIMSTDELSRRSTGRVISQTSTNKTGHKTLQCRCNEITHRLDEIKGQLETLIECNAENKDILVKQLSQQNETLEIRTHFPVQTEEKLEEMNEQITSENKQDYNLQEKLLRLHELNTVMIPKESMGLGLYPDINLSIFETIRTFQVKTMRSIIHPAGVCKNLKYIISTKVTMGYNLEGVHGKKSLKRLVNFYSAILEAIPNSAKNSGPAEEQLRKAIQLLKKREFKAISTAKTRKSSDGGRDIRLNFLGKANKEFTSTHTDESSTFEDQ